jgi:hypothetical protein
MSARRVHVQVTPPPAVAVRQVIQQVAGMDRYHRHVQSTPSATWAIAHNLGKRPCVAVVDSAGTEVEGDVQHVDDNSLTIGFSAAFSGEAYCN